MPKTKNKPGIHLHKGERKVFVPDTRRMAARYPYWYWNIIASNGREIARSSETYTRKGNAVKSIKIAADILHAAGFDDGYYDHSKPDCPLKSYL